MTKGTRQGPAARKPKGDTQSYECGCGDIFVGRPAYIGHRQMVHFDAEGQQRRKRTQVAQIVPGNFFAGETEPYRVALATAAFMKKETPGDYQVRKNKQGFGVYLRENL